MSVSTEQAKGASNDGRNKAMSVAPAPGSSVKGKEIVFARPADPTKPAFKRKRQTVLEEDDYVTCLEKIIARDFFPDLARLRAQHEYLQALEENDLDKLREVALRYQTPRIQRSGAATPAGGQTPAAPNTPVASSSWDSGSTDSSKQHGSDRQQQADTYSSTAANGRQPGSEDVEDEEDFVAVKAKKSDLDRLSLDQFVMKYTSEDNASFDVLAAEAQKRLQKQHAWLQNEVDKAERKLALDSASDKDSGKYYELKTWRYLAKNALMYHPEGAPLTAQDLLERSRRKATKVEHGNTRFDSDPYPGGTPSSISSKTGTTGPRAADLAHHLPKGVVDGRESPRVQGYGFVATPSPVPGKDMDPLMTWGEIDGTPFRLDGGDVTATPGGPVFNIPQQPKREQVADRLMDTIKRRKRNQASSAATPNTAAARLGRLTPMSPAAQRLALSLGGSLSSSRAGTPSSSSLGDALRSSYSATSRGRRLTPRVTPRASPRVTPRSTPFQRERRESTDAQEMLRSVQVTLPSDKTSLTDDLL